MIAEPLSAGAVQESVTCLSPAITVGAAGAAGAVACGVTGLVVTTGVPAPYSLMAATRTRYGTPGARPVIVADVVSAVPSETVFQVVPLSADHWMA